MRVEQSDMEADKAQEVLRQACHAGRCRESPPQSKVAAGRRIVCSSPSLTQSARRFSVARWPLQTGTPLSLVWLWG